MPMLTYRAATLAAMLFAAGACKKAPPAAQPPPPPPPPAPVAVASVDLGKAVGPDKRVTVTAETFGPRDTIYAAVTTSGEGSSTLTARWIYKGKKDVTVDSTSQTIAPAGPTTTEFHIMNSSAWPVGKYKVEVWLNGEKKADKDFEIKR